MNNKTKICSRCKREYPDTNDFFSKKRDKLRNICKECDKKLRKERAKKEKENSCKSRIVLTEKEERAFAKRAEEFNMSKADFLKLIILKGESEPFVKINPECFVTFNYQIMGIARNINQIAHVCNMTQNIHATDIENIREELKKIREWQSKLEHEFKTIDTSIKCFNDILTFDDI